jgi:hypothetical protein
MTDSCHEPSRRPSCGWRRPRSVHTGVTDHEIKQSCSRRSVTYVATLAAAAVGRFRDGDNQVAVLVPFSTVAQAWVEPGSLRDRRDDVNKL